MKLSELKIGQSAIIVEVSGDRALRGHLFDMGLTPRTCVTLNAIAPLGDPLELTLRGYRLTIRKDDASKIEVESVVTSCTGNCSNCSSSKKKKNKDSDKV